MEGVVEGSSLASWLGALLIGAGCFALGYLFSVRHRFSLLFFSKPKPTPTTNPGKNKKPPLEIEALAQILHDFKMVGDVWTS
ncbi:hypothetical protein QJS04_geneDACA013613 [Acorus gramineus]|uniref:Uncharacterized protein n=1 Tax=Acorus gramineus TaxID=55184 RepID=A0AAV9AFX8_ACOGR|nr:hypothetical protein QJS04_geneDACA013613 [Acorus gramineus]